MAESLFCLDIEVVENSAVLTSFGSANDVGEVSVTAPAGKKFVGGGHRLELASNAAMCPNSARIVRAYLSADFTTWTVGISGSGESVRVRAYGYAV